MEHTFFRVFLVSGLCHFSCLWFALLLNSFLISLETLTKLDAIMRGPNPCLHMSLAG